MRLDKFLKVSRLIKRRTLAKEVCDQGRVTVGGKVAKAGTVLQTGDEITIRFGNRMVTVRVEELRENVKKEDAHRMFTVIREESAPSSDNFSTDF
jgi:ribosomal 50S subunit-recycling heat shock protein